MSIREYVITLKNREALDDFYNDMETEGEHLYIPNRAVTLAHRRPLSRNTHYMLTDSEAEQIKNDPRVLAVELTTNELGIYPTPTYTQSSSNWNKSSTINNTHRNWGLYRCTLNSNIPNWGTILTPGGSAGTPSVSGTINITASGKHVDVIIVDGHIDPDHPEFAVNSNGTGGTRVIQYNWFQHNPAVTGGPQYNYIYPPYVDPTYPDENLDGISDRTTDNDHGAHVAGTACGNTQGWARDANIYNISPYKSNINFLSGESIFDYIREFHRTKPINPVTGRKNPTIVNNSWGYLRQQSISSLVLINYRGQQINGPFTVAQLNSYGIKTTSNNLNLRAGVRVSSVDADIEDCTADGIIVVGAAMNESYKIDTAGGEDYNNYLFDQSNRTLYFHRGGTPTASNTAICVGAVSTTADEAKANFSNCGPRIDVYAPGSTIISSINSNIPTNTYDFRDEFKYISKFSGTSMASPQVTGVLACLLEIYPNLNQASVTNYLYNTAKIGVMRDTGGGHTDLFSLQGSANRFLFYKNEREKTGQILPKAKMNLRPLTGQVYPRPRIYTYGPQSSV
jgi:subtilisin family serine protease